MDSNNNSKHFQLAIAYQEFLRSRNHPLKPGTPLPPCISEELHSTRSISENKPQNIFSFNSEIRQRKLDLEPLKGYEYVGIKDIRTYLTRTDKKKRNMNSTVKRSTESALSFSRVSQIKTQERYLTKEEVLGFLAPPKHRHTASMLDETYLSSDPTLDLKKAISTQNTTMGSSAQIPLMQTESSNLSHTFSMNKLLAKMNGYRRGWDHQLKVKKKQGHHHKYKTMKLDSILKNSEQFRSKMENMEKNTIIQKNNNLPAQCWKVMLRDQAEVKRTNEVERVIQAGFTNSGRSKFKKELSWIQEKDRQGHFFKLKKNDKDKQNAAR